MQFYCPAKPIFKNKNSLDTMNTVNFLVVQIFLYISYDEIVFGWLAVRLGSLVEPFRINR